MIRAALFDFGGVILSSPFEAFASYERDNGLPEGLIRRINATNPDTNAWAQLERGEVDLGGFCSLFEAEARALGHQVDGNAVIGCLGGEVRPTMARAVERCAEHLKTALLTNNFVLGPEAETTPVAAAGAADPEAVARAAIVARFDVIVESSVVGVRKPDPRFYEIACERLGIRPEEAVFLDDLGVNLKPARAMGMTTIKVTEPAAAIAELEDAVGFSLD